MSDDADDSVKGQLGDMAEGAIWGAAGGAFVAGAGQLVKRIVGVCHSFLPGTGVLLADGTRKAIEDVQAGDEVVTTDVTTGKTTEKKVSSTITTEGDKEFTDISVQVGDGYSSITATDTHLFWVPEVDAWVSAGDLQLGQWLRTSSGTHVQITAVRHYTKPQRTHDLSIEDIHAYYVLAGATPVLVHNCGGSKWTPDENYSPEAVAGRSAANKAYYETPQDIHDLVSSVTSNPNYPQRMTGPAGNRRPDVYGAHGAPRAAQRWRGSTIYDNGDPLSQARILVDGNGNMAYVGRARDGSHNYNQIIPYPWATRP